MQEIAKWSDLSVGVKLYRKGRANPGAEVAELGSNFVKLKSLPDGKVFEMKQDEVSAWSWHKGPSTGPAEARGTGGKGR